jgi:hypothetical protein
MSKDNNPSPQEAIDKIEIRIGSMSLQLGKEFKIIEQTLTNYANMVESLEGLVEKYELSTKKIHEVGGFVSMDIIQFITDITKVLEG